MNFRFKWSVAALALMIGVPAMADVKAGVDAWSRGDYRSAVEQWREPAIAGDPDAQFNLGQAYKLGRGVPADLAQAESWYAKAARQGHAQAQDNYALALYQENRRNEALPWLEKSVARDEKRTELVLGTMLFNGDGVSKDYVRAYALVSRSSQQGLAQGSQTLAQMDGYLSPEQRQQGLALADRIAADAKAARVANLAGAPVRPVARAAPVDTATDVPPPPEPGPPRMAATDLPPSHAPGPVRPVEHKPPRAPAPPVARAPVAVAVKSPPRTAPGGHWRVQLGAFREPGAAQALWSRVGARVGGEPVYARAGAVTRLQAGPFASKADAERACHASGVSCVVVPG